MSSDLLRTRQKNRGRSRNEDRSGNYTRDRKGNGSQRNPRRDQDENRLKQEIKMISQQVEDLNFDLDEYDHLRGDDLDQGKRSQDPGKRIKDLLDKVKNLGFENFSLKEKKEKNQKNHFYVNEDLEVDVEAFKSLKTDFYAYVRQIKPLKEKYKNDVTIFEEEANNKIFLKSEPNDAKYSLFRRALAEDQYLKMKQCLEVYESMIRSLEELEQLILNPEGFTYETYTVNKLLNSEFHMMRVKAQVQFRDLLKEQFFQSKNYEKIYKDYCKRVENDYDYILAQNNYHNRENDQNYLLKAGNIRDLGDDEEFYLDSKYSPFN